jgi:hypothetical protein
MIPIKVQCACGQKYSFDVEPVNDRMPWPVACPVCNADGTAAANAIIRQTMPPPAAPAPVPIAAAAPAMKMPVRSAPPAALAPVSETESAPAFAHSPLERLSQLAEDSGNAEKWKWWYFVLAGFCIAGYSIWQAYDQHRIKPLGELFFAVLCIAIGIWDFQYKRKKKRAGG